MIGSHSRCFYCVSCNQILWVEEGEPQDCSSNSSYTDLLFRTGFYRNEMPLGYCRQCRTVHHTQHAEDQALRKDPPPHYSFLKSSIEYCLARM